ncbi:hypothetical protein [Natronoglomus mannanivorans]|uniref:Uncharacterized protein n=1 Tax=Natronoglomus mannanivorans TaxID=2979990 RepID=A0AAP2Z2Y1_9EURY|nr:hypothetical protein [Halobacteria archaeon AArc-xg1-1]
MKFQHTDGELAPRRKSLNDGRQVFVEDGVFEVDPCSDALRDRLVEAGHEPLEESPADTAVKDDVQKDDADADADTDDADEDDEEEEEKLPTAGDYDEETLVNGLDYNEKQELASQYDHIAGNASAEKLTEELIKQRREEVDD